MSRSTNALITGLYLREQNAAAMYNAVRNRRPPAPDRTLPPHLSGIKVHRRHAHQRRNLLTIELAQLRQLRHQRHWPSAGPTPGIADDQIATSVRQSSLFSLSMSLAISRSELIDLPLEQPDHFLNQLDRQLVDQPFQPVLLHHQHPDLHLAGARVIRSSRITRFSGTFSHTLATSNAANSRQHLRIDRIGLGQFAQLHGLKSRACCGLTTATRIPRLEQLAAATRAHTSRWLQSPPTDSLPQGNEATPRSAQYPPGVSLHSRCQALPEGSIKRSRRLLDTIYAHKDACGRRINCIGHGNIPSSRMRARVAAGRTRLWRGCSGFIHTTGGDPAFLRASSAQGSTICCCSRWRRELRYARTSRQTRLTLEPSLVVFFKDDEGSGVISVAPANGNQPLSATCPRAPCDGRTGNHPPHPVN